MLLDQCRELTTLTARSLLVCSFDLQSQARELAGKARSNTTCQFLTYQKTGRSHNRNHQCLPSQKESAVEDVQYVDEDGGFIICKHFPRLAHYLKERNIAISTLGLDTHDYSPMSFIEADHDAKELGHVYTIECEKIERVSSTAVCVMPRERKEWGNVALVTARGHLAQAI